MVLAKKIPERSLCAVFQVTAEQQRSGAPQQPQRMSGGGQEQGLEPWPLAETLTEQSRERGLRRPHLPLFLHLCQGLGCSSRQVHPNCWRLSEKFRYIAPFFLQSLPSA